MADYTELDADSVARIGLMFLDGDSFEEIALDKLPQVDYDFDKFNECKKVVMKIERMNPAMDVTVFLWQRRPDNEYVAVPMVAGKSLPLEGYGPSKITPEKESAFNGVSASMDRGDEGVSHFYPIKNSDAEIVGVLELLVGKKTVVDI